MISRLFNYYLIARESLFYTPAIICGLYVAGCLGVFLGETAYLQEGNEIPFVYNGTIEDAQAVIMALLSAMITMTTLVISVTMVVLSLSASQLGPRLMKIFMSDSVTKIYVGMFFGSIAACFVMTGILHEVAVSQNVPRLTVSIVFLLCFLNLFVLLAYVQHVSNLSIADQIITRVYGELCGSIKRLNDYSDQEKVVKKEVLPKDFKKKAQTIYNGKDGYVQTLDYKDLVALAEEHDLTIYMQVKPGDYLIQGAELAKIHPKTSVSPDIQKSIEAAILYGNTRTASQDVEYSVRHLVEIGLRALSPGINDNFTALIVLNKLSSALALIFKKGLPNRVYENDNGKVRVVGAAFTEKQVVMNAFSKIRNAAQDKPDILSRMIELIGTLKAIANTEEEHRGLDYQLACIKDHIDNHFKDTQEGKCLQKALGEKADNKNA